MGGSPSDTSHQFSPEVTATPKVHLTATKGRRSVRSAPEELTSTHVWYWDKGGIEVEECVDSH
jgi:hypothetical protein